jgi:hypothetical protein
MVRSRVARAMLVKLREFTLEGMVERLFSSELKLLYGRPA